MKFDPKEWRDALDEFEIEYYRETSYAESKKEGSLNGAGFFMTGGGIRCLMVGYFDVGHELLSKARKFLRASIEYEEAPHIAPDLRLADLALCSWVLDRRHNPQILKSGIEWRESWFSQPKNLCKSEVQWSLPRYLDAEEYETLIRRYESVGLKKPTNLRRIQGEGTISYVIARHRLGLDYTPDEVVAAVDTFLKRRVSGWISGQGRDTDAALWMKLAFWKPDDDPVATILRCYDYLPDVKPPKYPQPT